MELNPPRVTILRFWNGGGWLRPGFHVNIQGIHDRDGYVEACLEGTFQASQLEPVIDAIVKALIQKDCKRLLLNSQPMTGKPPSFMERYQVGMAMLRLPKGVRVSELIRADWMDPEQFGLRVAQNRGADADMFTDRDQAVAWLLGKSENPPPPAPPPI